MSSDTLTDRDEAVLDYVTRVIERIGEEAETAAEHTQELEDLVIELSAEVDRIQSDVARYNRQAEQLTDLEGTGPTPHKAVAAFAEAAEAEVYASTEVPDGCVEAWEAMQKRRSDNQQ